MQDANRPVMANLSVYKPVSWRPRLPEGSRGRSGHLPFFATQAVSRAWPLKSVSVHPLMPVSDTTPW